MLIEDIALVLVVLVVVTQLLLPMALDWPAFWLFRRSNLREARARKQRFIEEAQKRKIKADADRIRRH